MAKQGEYGAALFTRDGFFALPAYPLEDVIDPTGAATRSPAGSSATSPPIREQVSRRVLRRAMAHGTALASFNVEEFGTERVERLTGEEITARVEALGEMTRFSSGSRREAPHLVESSTCSGMMNLDLHLVDGLPEAPLVALYLVCEAYTAGARRSPPR